eukprot:CAMPEP_0175624986 /NCGR_PEP_ID=MMETSP0096-20121207/70239_1 /TAXON_ID=311494 /ORGANISM="Alexandrium monilatum, Strain CCMP3105" /LENGTH=378 /DNA_ID=CAMNT_0016930315 /DNA_START=61 /DNA_END=1198 /DNA_ORIENTATION=+
MTGGGAATPAAVRATGKDTPVASIGEMFAKRLAPVGGTIRGSPGPEAGVVRVAPTTMAGSTLLNSLRAAIKPPANVRSAGGRGKEYRDFVFGRPKVVEGDCAAAAAGDVPYTIYGSIKCEVFEAVLDEEVDSDQELRGQTTFYRGAGLHGSFDERLVPEGKKKHFLYSSVTVQGSRSSISNSTRGRWWVRGQRRLRDLEVRYREAHSLMLLGVDPRALGLSSCKEEDGEGEAKKEELDDRPLRPGAGAEPGTSLIEVCDLTADGAPGGRAAWTVRRRRRAEPVGVEERALEAPRYRRGTGIALAASPVALAGFRLHVLRLAPHTRPGNPSGVCGVCGVRRARQRVPQAWATPDSALTVHMQFGPADSVHMRTTSTCAD